MRAGRWFPRWAVGWFPPLAFTYGWRSHVRGRGSVCAGMGMKQPFEKVVEQHGGTVLRVCRVVLGVHDAEDAWSETFLAAMRAYPALPANPNPEPCLVPTPPPNA